MIINLTKGYRQKSFINKYFFRCSICDKLMEDLCQNPFRGVERGCKNCKYNGLLENGNISVSFFINRNSKIIATRQLVNLIVADFNRKLDFDISNTDLLELKKLADKYRVII
jgi:hypothetical protein